MFFISEELYNLIPLVFNWKNSNKKHSNSHNLMSNLIHRIIQLVIFIILPIFPSISRVYINLLHLLQSFLISYFSSSNQFRVRIVAPLHLWSFLVILWELQSLNISYQWPAQFIVSLAFTESNIQNFPFDCLSLILGHWYNAWIEKLYVCSPSICAVCFFLFRFLSR